MCFENRPGRSRWPSRRSLPVSFARRRRFLPGRITTARSNAATWFSRRCGSRVHHARTGGGGPRASAPKVQPYRQPADARAGWAKEFLRQEFRNRVWRRSSARLAGPHDVPARPPGGGGARRSPRAAAPEPARPRSRACRARSGRRAIFSRWSGAPVTRAARSTGRHEAGASRDPPSSRSFTPPRSSTGIRRCRSCRISAASRRLGIRNGIRGMPGVEQADALTLAGRADRIEQRGRGRSAAEGGFTCRVCVSPSDAGLNGLPDVPSLALGTGLVSPLDLTARTRCSRAADRSRGRAGLSACSTRTATRSSTGPSSASASSAKQSAFQMVTMLRDVIDHGTGSPARALGVRGPVGGKTGTTDKYRDAWFVGFSSSVVVGVWVGFDQPAPIGTDAYGARIALPIWADFMKRSGLGAARRRVRRSRWPRGRRVVQCVVSSPARRLFRVHRVLQERGRGADRALSDSPGEPEGSAPPGPSRDFCARSARKSAESSTDRERGRTPFSPALFMQPGGGCPAQPFLRHQIALRPRSAPGGGFRSAPSIGAMGGRMSGSGPRRPAAWTSSSTSSRRRSSVNRWLFQRTDRREARRALSVPDR